MAHTLVECPSSKQQWGRLSECSCGGPAYPLEIPVFENHFSAEMLLAGVEEAHHVAAACRGWGMGGTEPKAEEQTRSK